MLKEETLDNTGYMEIKPSGPFCAGSRWTLKLTYYTGEIGIKKGGSIRITIPHGFTTPQIDEFLKDGFVTAESSKDEVSISLKTQSRIYCRYKPKLGHSGAFGKSLFVYLDKGELKKSDSIEITYGNTNYYGQETWGPKPPRTPILSGEHEFTVGIDPDGKRKAPITGYYLLPHSPSITVIPRKAAKIFPVAPSNIDKGKDFSLHVILTDKYLNPIQGEVEQLPVQTKQEGKNISNTATSDMFSVESLGESDKFTHFIVNFKGSISERSNPIKFGKYMGSDNLYWGDLHAHSKYSDGMGTPEEILSYARDIVGLDFGSVTDHDDIGPYLTPSEWEDIQEKTAKFNQPNKFISFLGYEYRSSLADMIVYYPKDTGKLMCGKEERWSSPDKILSEVRKENGMIIPHMHFGADWRGYDPNLYRVMEIYSSHGSAEYIGCPRQIPYLGKQLQKGSEGNVDVTFQEILAQGMKLGVTAGSDSHSGRPGLSTWTRVGRTYKGGLTAVFADQKTRESIWKALYNRHCYGTTGARIYLEFSINDYPMGSEIEADKRHIKVRAIGVNPISRIDLIKNNENIQSKKDCGVQGRIEVEDTPDSEEDYYYLRVTQQDGEMAWSSPIWVRT